MVPKTTTQLYRSSTSSLTFTSTKSFEHTYECSIDRLRWNGWISRGRTTWRWWHELRYQAVAHGRRRYVLWLNSLRIHDLATRQPKVAVNKGSIGSWDETYFHCSLELRDLQSGAFWFLHFGCLTILPYPGSSMLNAVEAFWIAFTRAAYFSRRRIYVESF